MSYTIKMMSILKNIDQKIEEYLNGEVKNPILKKIIEEEIIFSKNLGNIFYKFFQTIVETANYQDNLNNLSKLLNNLIVRSNHFENALKKDQIKKYISDSFMSLSKDEHMFLIISINNDNKNIFELMSDDKSIINIIKYISESYVNLINSDYFIKCIEVCNIINKNISNLIVEDYIMINDNNLIKNDNLLVFFIKYIFNNCNGNIIKKLNNIIINKLIIIKENLNNLQLTNMEFAYEIYKLGKIITDTNILIYNNNITNNTLELSNEQLEYINKAIHTCIINKNYQQAQNILAIIYYLTNKNIIKFIDYYNKFLLHRIKNPNILVDEQVLWNINDDYATIINSPEFVSYFEIINNFKYSNIINNELSKIKIKNSDINMNKLNIMLVNMIENNAYDNITHHKFIQEYINNLNKYIDCKTKLQYLEHDMDNSQIKLKTPLGSIKCSLIFGSILLYLNESDMTIEELSGKIKINEDSIRKRINSLIKLNIVVENNNKYKYVEPYGEVECKLLDDDVKEELVIEKFTDIIMTIESQIMKHVKSCKMNKLELERRIQEYVGSSYVRSIFYQCLDRLKEKYYIEEKDAIIEYVV
jgi:hypothetical protein